MSARKIVSDKKTYRYILQNRGYLHCSVVYELDHCLFRLLSTWRFEVKNSHIWSPNKKLERLKGSKIVHMLTS